MNTYTFSSIGFVVNDFNDPVSYQQIKDKESKIIVSAEYREALLNIEKCEYLDIVFYFHKVDEKSLTGTIHSGEKRGVFASRSPKRTNSIGVTTVKLIERDDLTLTVTGLDAINNSPVLDIKSADTSLFAMQHDENQVHLSILKSDPRIEIRNYIVANKTDTLLVKAAQMHGHFCPGLAMGVMAATYAMNEMKAMADGMEDLLAITETNNCFADGVQFVSGCSFGNNSLIYYDLGKTAFTLCKRDGKGIRICSKHESSEVISSAFPEFESLYDQVVKNRNHDPELVARYKNKATERAFGTLKIPFNSLFNISEVNANVPGYAKIDESVVCSICNESVMKSRTIRRNNQIHCLTCAEKSCPVLDGNGIHTSH